MSSELNPVENVSERELIEKWRRIVFEPAAADVEELLDRFPDRRTFRVPFEACGTDYRFTQPLFEDPDRTIEAGRRALQEVVEDRFDGGIDPDDRVYLRVTDVPDSARRPLSEIDADHLKRLVVVGGTVEHVERPQPRAVTACFECERCGEYTTVPQPTRQLRRVGWCSRCNTAGTLSLASNRCVYVDTQTLTLRDGDRELPVVLEHDLTDRFTVGDRIDVTAIPRARLDDGTTVGQLELEAISAERRATDECRSPPRTD